MNVNDFVIRIKNATLAKRNEVEAPYSKNIYEVSMVLFREGYLEQVKKETLGKRKIIVAKIRYENRRPIFTDVELVSKPSLRVYIGTDEIKKYETRGKTLTILSTNKGILTGRQAQKERVGGELLFKIW